VELEQAAVFGSAPKLLVGMLAQERYQMAPNVHKWIQLAGTQENRPSEVEHRAVFSIFI